MSLRHPLPTRTARVARPVARATGIAAAAALALGGCTALSGGYVAPVVVTVTPTVTVTPKAASSTSPSATATTTALPEIASDDLGKKFDLGRITTVDEQEGVKVIVLDRVNSRSIPSSRVFEEGITLEPHTRNLFREGSSQTYRLPVQPSASFTKMTCVSVDQPAQTASSTLDELAGLTGKEAIVQVALDDKGWVTKVTSDPVCS